MPRLKTAAAAALLVAAAMVVLAATATAYPYNHATITLLKPSGDAFANQTVYVVLWNETANQPIAYALGATTDSAGTVKLTLPAPIETPHPGTTYNLTVAWAWAKYGTAFYLLHLELTDADLDTYLNGTATLDYYYEMYFNATADLDGDGRGDVPLYFADPTYKWVDKALFEVRIGSATVQLVGNSSGVAGPLPVGLLYADIDGYRITVAGNVSFTKTLYWLIQHGEPPAKVKVGEDKVELFNTTAGRLVNVTDLVLEQYNVSIVDEYNVTLDADHVFSVNDTAHTFLAKVHLLTPCGAALTDYGSPWLAPPIYVEFESQSFGKLRTGAMNPYTGDAPVVGYAYGGDVYFWLPNVSLIYPGENLTVRVVYDHIPIYDVSFNTTALMDSASRPLKFYNRFGQNYFTYNVSGGVSELWLNTSVVPATITVFDKGPNPVQPLQGAIVEVAPQGYDPYWVVTDAYGELQLPPFTGLGGGSTAGGVPIRSQHGSTVGLLPVPFPLWEAGENFTYTFRVLVPLPGTSTYVDVTSKAANETTVTYNLSAVVAGGCTVQRDSIFADVYRVNAKTIDLCGEPITAADDPNAMLLLVYSGPDWRGEPVNVTFDVRVGSDGIAFVSLPRGAYTVRMAFKGVLMDPVNTSLLRVEGNIYNTTFSTYQFPVGNLTLTVTHWDKEEPLFNVSVTLRYLKNNVTMLEESKLTDCAGQVTFEKVPLNVSRSATASYAVIAEINLTRGTPGVRPGDAGLRVGYWDITKLVLHGEASCNTELTLPAWVYDPVFILEDHKGTVLQELRTGRGNATVALAINDTYYGDGLNLTRYCGGDHIAVYDVPLDLRIFNVTGRGGEAWRSGNSTAVFKLTSSQEPGHFHLFYAGMELHLVVWYGGVIVYDYNVTLPAPSRPLDPDVLDPLTVFINETGGNETTVHVAPLYNYTFTENWTVRPLIASTPGYWWGSEAGEPGPVRLHLPTWVVDLKVYALSNGGRGLVPGLNLTLSRADAVNWTWQLDAPTAAAIWDRLVHESSFSLHGWLYNYSGVDAAGEGYIVLPVAVWTPTRAWSLPGGWGAKLRRVFLVAGEDWGTPWILDTPPGAGGVAGYVVGPYNATTNTLTTLVEGRPWVYPTFYKFMGGEWHRLNRSTPMVGDGWNLTVWSGAAKAVRTLAMDGFCACVKKPGEEGLVGLPGQPVNVTPLTNRTGCPYCESAPTATRVTGSDGCALFKPSTAATEATPLGKLPVYRPPLVFKRANSTDWPTPYMRYRVSTVHNIDAELNLSRYNLTADQVVDPDVLLRDVYFNESNNIVGNEVPTPTGCCPEQICVELDWSSIRVKVFDWAGRPLRNAMVAAILRSPVAKSRPSTLAVTRGDGTAELLAPPGTQRYQLLVYWRDSYLLFKAGKIPKSIVVFDTVTDYDTPRTYMPGEGTTLETFVYVGMIKLVNAQGKPLSPDALSKITVTITWPDGVVTQDTLGHGITDDGVALIILNRDTVRSWPLPASAAYSPETPFEAQSQAPHGAYKVSVAWKGLGTLAASTVSIEKGRFETSKKLVTVPLPVRDRSFRLVSPYGTPLAGVDVTVKYPDGTVVNTTSAGDGTVTVREVPGAGPLVITIKSLMGRPVSFNATVPATATSVTVDRIGRLIVHVVGSRGQGLPGASVEIAGVGAYTTDGSGTVEVELPIGTYTVTARKGGRTATTTVAVNPARDTEATLKLDIFISIASWEMSSGEFAGMVLFFVMLVIVLFIVAHEYSAWRKRRLAKVIAPASKPGNGLP